MATGLWNIGGLNLPDFKVTETINNLLGGNALPDTWNNAAVSNPGTGFDYSQSVAPAGSTSNSIVGPAIQPNAYMSPAKTSTPTPTPQPTQQQQQPSGGGGFDMKYYPGWDPVAALADWKATGGSKANNFNQAPTVDPYAGLRSEISSGYDQYLSNLDQQLAALPGQVENQNQIVSNQYNQGVNDLNTQLSQGQSLLGQQRSEIAANQKKNLTNLDENMRNMFMAGNVYLGSRGAGDSSAANQYSYALTKEGNKARGDQMSQAQQALSQVQQREFTLKSTVDNEMNRIKSDADTKKLQVGQWFADAQQKVKDAMASGRLNKSTDLANLSKTILNQAMQQLQAVQANAQQQQNSLVTWAQNNSKTIGELKANLQQALNVQIPQIAPANLSGAISQDARGNATMNPLVGYGATSEQTKKGLFG